LNIIKSVESSRHFHAAYLATITWSQKCSFSGRFSELNTVVISCFPIACYMFQCVFYLAVISVIQKYVTHVTPCRYLCNGMRCLSPSLAAVTHHEIRVGV
jgi:hypothetical protein